MRQHSQQFGGRLVARTSGRWVAALLVVLLLALRSVLPGAHIAAVHGEAGLAAGGLPVHSADDAHEHSPDGHGRHESSSCGMCFELLIAKAADTTALAALALVGVVVESVPVWASSRLVIGMTLVDAPPRGPPQRA